MCLIRYRTFVSEDAGPNTLVATVLAKDPDGDGITYKITTGNDEGNFVIDSQKGKTFLSCFSQLTGLPCSSDPTSSAHSHCNTVLILYAFLNIDFRCFKSQSSSIHCCELDNIVCNNQYMCLNLTLYRHSSELYTYIFIRVIQISPKIVQPIA